MKSSYNTASLEHDELNEPMVQAPISIGILLLLSEQQLVGNVILEVDRHEVIVLSSELRAWVNARAEPVSAFYLWQSSRR